MEKPLSQGVSIRWRPPVTRVREAVQRAVERRVLGGVQHEFVELPVVHRANRIAKRGNVREQFADQQVIAIKLWNTVYSPRCRQTADRARRGRVHRKSIDPAARHGLRAESERTMDYSNLVKPLVARGSFGTRRP